MSNALQTLTSKLAATLNMGDGQDLIKTLKATAFKGEVTDAQMTALMVVANQYGLNPWTKEIYAFPDKQNGIVPVVGVDGWSRIINSHPEFDGLEFQQDAESCTCIIYRKDRSHPIKTTEWLEECYRPAFKSREGREITGPWQSHPKRMLRHKAMIQCARLAFGYTGIFDQDEAERISEATQTRAEQVVSSNAPDTLADYEAEHLQPMRDAAMQGTEALTNYFKNLPAGADKSAFWSKHGAELKAVAKQADSVVDVAAKEVA